MNTPIKVLITGIDVFGYFLGKIVGNKHGFTLASFAGGFVYLRDF